MSDICETVRVVAEDPEAGGFVVINKSDFDPEKHELYEEGSVDAKKAEKESLIARGVELKIGNADAFGKMRVDTLRNKVTAAEAAIPKA